VAKGLKIEGCCYQAMSEDQLKALLAKLKEDAELKDKFRRSDLDAAVVMAQEAGFDVNKTDWLKYQAKYSELSDENLEGGNWWQGLGMPWGMLNTKVYLCLIWFVVEKRICPISLKPV
jgi:predicted ribosomally synthesized peptide with nif11-like leader